MSMKSLYCSYPTFSDVICNLPHPHTTSKCVYLDTHFSTFFLFHLWAKLTYFGVYGPKNQHLLAIFDWMLFYDYVSPESGIPMKI